MNSALRILQTKLNADALFSYYNLPLLTSVNTLVDRTIWKEESSFMEEFLKISQKTRPDGTIEPFDPEKHRFKRWDYVKNHGVSAVGGWREYIGMYSMQIIRHEHGTLETDFDLFNPDFGLGPVICHFWEVIIPGKTDSFRVLKGLRKRGLRVVDARTGLCA